MIDRASSNPAVIDTTLDSRAVTFENTTGERGAGGAAHGGRKGAPNRLIAPGERVVLADLTGPGIVRHIWLTIPPAPPEKLRSQLLEVFYDGADEPSISVPVLDFFGLPHGRLAAYESALTAMLEGRGFTSYLPMPFREGMRIEYQNASAGQTILYFQVDYTLQPELPADLGTLHVTWRRQNPTVQRGDFVIVDGLHGPGRFLGCNVGVRVIDPSDWYGEGEVKIFRDGDTDLPTICGTGLEDYVGSAWGLGRFHSAQSGAPLVVCEHPGPNGAPVVGNPDLVGFYRWHLSDPVMFSDDLTVTIQQIGAKFFPAGAEEQMAAYEQTNPVAGVGWLRGLHPGMLAWGITERVDDYCATAYLYLTDVQAVPRVDLDLALADIARKPYETASPMEMLNAVTQPVAD